MEAKKTKTAVKTWILIWGLGIAGQLCWNIENQWFNTFIYAKISLDPAIISWMVALSAIATTFSTFFFGTLSDRRGSRKPFIAFGYMIWGVFTIAFGLTEFIPHEEVKVAAVMVVAADVVMSFFGSMGNDAGFNAWTNDLMRENNRGQIGAALAIQPVIGTIVGTVIGGVIVGNAPNPKDRNYMALFITMGVAVILVGIISLFTMKDDVSLKPNREGRFWRQFASVFNFKKFFKQKELLWVNVANAVFFIGFNVYFAHMGNYIIYKLGFTEGTMGIIEGISLVLAMLVVIPATILINKKKSPLVSFASVLLNIIGLLIIYLFVKPETVNTAEIFNPVLMLGIFFVGAGYVVILQTTTVWAKQLYPSESKGQFEGIRILFFVLIPMVFGSLISSPLIKATGDEFTDALGVKGYIPTNTIFIVGAAITVLTVIPLIFARIEHNKRIAAEAAAEADIAQQDEQ